MGKINRTKLLDRQHDRRDARLFIIATEGAVTEKKYFEMFGSSRIKVEVLATGSDNKSAPKYVFDRLNAFKEQFDLHEDDMLWLVVDVDRWNKDGELSQICREAKQKNYHLAISNPCFEVWLCLHFGDLDPEDKTCKQFKARLGQILGDCSGTLNTSPYAPFLADAVERAKILHPDRQQNWPPSIGTHVYRLVEILLQLTS